MTTLVIVLGVLILAVIGLGLGLWQLSRGSRSRPGEGEPTQAAQARNYSPMTRLFDGRDLAFLKTQPGFRQGMARQLRLHRRQVLSLYLTQVHQEFRRFWAYGRELAAHSDDPQMASAAVNQFFTFYALYVALKLQGVVSLVVYVPMDTRKLVGVVQALQKRAREATHQPSRGWSGVTAS